MMRKAVPSISRVGDSPLRKWHRWAGWTALGGFGLLRLIGRLASADQTSLIETHYLAHGSLTAICAFAVLGKIWGTQRKVKRRMTQVVPWVIIAVSLGTAFAVFTCVLAAQRWLNASAEDNGSGWLIRQGAVLGHISLGVMLMRLGRLALQDPLSESG